MAARKWWAEVDEAFWASPASLTGQNHRPGDTQGEHARRVFALACRSWRRVPWAPIRKNRGMCRSFLRAALFHDVGKLADRETHDLAGFLWMISRDRLAAVLILRHMGRWGVAPEIQVDALMSAGCGHLLTAQTMWLCDLLASCDYFDACCFQVAPIRAGAISGSER